eukprot:6183615-Pleurochrysis_carterae.AAC.1
MPTEYATSGRVCVEQYNNAPTKDWYDLSRSGGGGESALDANASSTSLGRSSAAGACVRCTAAGTPSGRNVLTMCVV